MAAASSIREDPPRRRRQYHEPFSETHPIPQVEAYFTDLSKPVKQPDEAGAYSTASWFGGGGAARNDDKREVKGQGPVRPKESPVSADDQEDQEEHRGAQNKKQREKSRKKDLHRGSSRVVQDPVTLRKIEITNTDASFDDAMDPAKSRGESILQQDFPPIEWESIADETRAKIVPHAVAAVVPAFILPYTVPFVFSILILSFWWYIVYHHYDKTTQSIFENYKYDAERKRGESTIRQKERQGMDIDTDKVMGRSSGIGKAGGDETGIQHHRESVEWANQMLRNLWPIIDPSLFTSLTDMLEDVMQASMPKAINTVRITDMSQGNLPLRIISIRPLDEQEMKTASEDPKDKAVDEALADEEHEETGASHAKHVNLEVAFAYRALPVKGNKVYAKAQNMHILIDFGLGMKGVFGKSLPIWVEIRGIVGTMRLRLELTATPPFVKHATVSLCGLPKIEIAAIPMLQSALKLNAMNLPLIRTFISNSISTALYEYVAPQSLTVDLGQMLVGDDIKKDTLAMGVVVITIHSAEVKAADIGGTSDPYVTVSLAKFGKPLFSTRIATKEVQPVWEATTAVLIRPEAFRVKERIALQIWDSDRLTADDELGRVEVDLIELFQKKGKMTRHSSSLSHLNHATEKTIPGSIDYSIGFFDKVPPRQSTKKKEVELAELPEDLRNHPEMQPEKAKSLNEAEELITSTPPDPDFPTGILSIQIHEGYELERESIRPTGGSRNDGSSQFKHPPSAEGANREEGKALPSSYCRVRINDDTVFQTRVKPITSMPFFNTSHEAFIRNFRDTTVTVIVRDSKNREHDPLLGMIYLKLGDVFRTASQRTGSWPLTGGVGYGRLRISLLFRSVSVRLPPTLHGFDTASVVVWGNLALTDLQSSQADALRTCKVELRTSHGRSDIAKRQDADQESDVIEYANEKLALPVKRRYSSPLIISFNDSHFGIRQKPIAEAVIWLMDIPDHSRKRIQVPVYRAKDFARLEQNYWTPFDFEESSPRDREYHTSDSHNETLRRARDKMEERGLQRIATLSIDLVIEPGLSSAHKTMTRKDPRQRVVMEGFDWAIMSGLRKDPIMNGNPDMSDISSGRRGPEETSQEDTDEDDDKGMEEYLTAKRNDAGLRDLGDSPSTSYGSQGESFQGQANTRQSSYASRRSGKSRGTSDMGSGDVEGEKGWHERYHDWRVQQHNLHLRQRGLMQFRIPFRTGIWIKDSVKQGSIKLKNKFDLNTRQPDIESEV